MKVTIEEGHKIAIQVASKFQRRCYWILSDDLYQEAWAGMLNADGYNPDKGDRRKYLWGAAANSCSDFICKYRLPVSGYFKIIDKLAELHSVHEDLVRMKGGDTPEDKLIRKHIILAVRRKVKDLLGVNDAQAKLLILFMSKEYQISKLPDKRSRDRLYNLKRSLKKQFRKSGSMRIQYEV